VSAVQDATFATAIACIDGRVHEPLVRWMRRRFGVDHVDLVTEPGADLVCAHGPADGLAALVDRVAVSARAHASRVLVITGHEDCAAHPVDEAAHRADIARAVARLRAEVGDLAVVGVWVGADAVAEIEPAEAEV
jgi:orotidine-5'-phosphate decarboxylase